MFVVHTYFDFMGGDFVSPFTGGIVIAVVSGREGRRRASTGDGV
jgi:hypothetical protein